MIILCKNNVNGAKGIGLIEMAVFILVTGTMIVAGAPFMQYYLNSRHLSETNTKVLQAQQALKAYYQTHNKELPCPAPRNAAVDTAGYGKSVACSASGGALGALGDGTARLNGSLDPVTGNPIPVRVGALPVRDLGLPDGADMDGYGHRLVYAVTEAYATNPPPATMNYGAITVQDTSGISATSIQGNAVYVVNAFGADDNGAYDAQGKRGKPCNPGSAAGKNCDDSATASAIFVNTIDKSYDVTGVYITNSLAFEAGTCGSSGTSSVLGTTCPANAHIYVYKNIGPLLAPNGATLGPWGSPWYGGGYDTGGVDIADSVAYSAPGINSPNGPRGGDWLTSANRVPNANYYTDHPYIPDEDFTIGFPFDPTLQTWFGACYDGSFYAPYDGLYSFIGAVDDGVVIWMDSVAGDTVNKPGAAGGIGAAAGGADPYPVILNNQGYAQGWEYNSFPYPDPDPSHLYAPPVSWWLGYTAAPSFTTAPGGNLWYDPFQSMLAGFSGNYGPVPIHNPAGEFQPEGWPELVGQSKNIWLTKGYHSMMVEYWQGLPNQIGLQIWAFGPFGAVAAAAGDPLDAPPDIDPATGNVLAGKSQMDIINPRGPGITEYQPPTADPAPVIAETRDTAHLLTFGPVLTTPLLQPPAAYNCPH